MPTKPKLKFTPWGFKLKVKRSNAGHGFFALQEIPKGACIIEYKGRKLSKEETHTINSKYLFVVHARMMIDGSARSNSARYINHSCRPNAEVEIRNHRVWIMARKKIKVGEEITYDYEKEYWDEYIKPKGCRCEKCRGK